MIPERIGSVRLGRLLWAGGGTTTYAGVDPARDAPVAVTVTTAIDDASVHRFLDAARTLGLIRSRRVVRVFEAGRIDGGGAYAITELPGPETVADRIADRQGRPVSFAEAFATATEAAECLLAAHGHGVVYEGVTTSSLRYVAGDDGRERLVVAAWSVVPVAERVGATPAQERAAILDWAARLVPMLAAGSSGPDGQSGPAEEATETGREIMQRLTFPVPPAPPAEDAPVTPVSEPASGPPQRRLPLAAIAGTLLVGLSVGAAIGWVATRSDSASSPVANPASTTRATTPAGTPAARPSTPAAPQGSASAVATSGGATVVPSAGATPAASTSAQDPQGRSGRYTGFITATTDGCGSLKEGRNYAMTVNVDVQNQGKQAILTITLSYRSEPIAITVTLAENGAFRGDYNIAGTAGSMTGRFAGERITDARGKEDACEYAWSAKRG